MTLNINDLPILLSLAKENICYGIAFNHEGLINKEASLFLPLNLTDLYKAVPASQQEALKNLLKSPFTFQEISLQEGSPPFQKKVQGKAIVTPSGQGYAQTYLFFFPNEKTASIPYRLMDIGMVTAGLFHDLNNALSNLSLQAHCLKQKNLKEQDIQNICEQVDRLSALTRQVLQHVKSGKQSTKKALFSQAMDMSLKLFRLSLPATISCFDNLSSLPPIYISLSASSLGHIILNLLTNARNAIGKKKGEIYIRATLSDKALCLSIEDTGGGSLKNEVEELFHTEVSNKGGGLGLALCRQIIEQAGGSLYLENIPKTGMRAQLLIPIAPPHS